jgi:hypothetical protein
VACEAGTYRKASELGDKCNVCLPGAAPNADATDCVSCPPGTASGTGRKCELCAANAFSARGALVCETCNEGLLTNKSSCEICPDLSAPPSADSNATRCQCKSNYYLVEERYFQKLYEVTRMGVVLGGEYYDQGGLESQHFGDNIWGACVICPYATRDMHIY